MIIYPIPGKKQTDKQFDVSVIVPMYKSKGVIEEQIRRWPQDEPKLDIEIVYVDDACPEHSSQAVMQGWANRPDAENYNVKLVLNKKNKGFGEACNTGVHHAQGKYIIFLNADTVPEPFWVKPIFEAFEKDMQIGIVGNLQLKEGGVHHGTIDGAGSQWDWGECNFLHIGRHVLDNEYLEEPIYPDQLPTHLNCLSDREMVTGCCLAIRKNLFDYVGGFNNYYRIGYWEDSELNMAVRELGYRVVFTPESKIWHKLSHAKVGKHAFHDINKQYFMNKWDASGRMDKLVVDKRPLARPKVKRILVKRDAANGDVLVAAGVLPALKEKYPEAEIHFSTNCGKVLLGNPHIDKMLDQIEAFNNLHRYQRIIELDGAYERRPTIPLTTAYAEEAGIRPEAMEYFVQCADEIESYEIPELKDYIVIHAGATNWVGRNWSTEGFQQIAQWLLDEGHQVVCIGKGADREVPCTIDLRSRITFFEMNKLVRDAKLFVGIDSMPMHIAQILDTPGVSFFGCIDPKLRIFNSKMTGVTAPNLPCLGCHHRRLAPAITLQHCETGTLDCEKMVTVEYMKEQIKRKINAT